MKLKVKMYDIFVTIICLLIFGYSIFVGSPIRNNTNVFNLIVLTLFLIYVFVMIIKNKKYKIIHNKMDILVLMLSLSSYIAIIFKNYSNLESTIDYIIKYTSLLSIYFMVRDSIIKDKKYISYYFNTLIIAGFSIFILGLDNLTFNTFKNFLEITGNVNISNESNRFLGIFGYANTTAIFMLLIFIISVFKIITSEKIIQKIFYNTALLVSLITLIMSYSRATWVFTILVILALIFLLKEDRTKYIEIMIRNTLISIIASLFIIKNISSLNYGMAWLGLLVAITLNIGLLFLSKYSIKILNKFKMKTVLLITLAFILAIIIIWNIGIHMTKPMVLFNNVYIKNDTTQDIINVQPNSSYKYEFDISSKVAYTNDPIYKISVCERNQYDDIITEHYIEFGNYEGTKTIEFNSTEYTRKILIKYITSNHVAQRGLIINSLKINDKNIPVNYKFLPRSIVEKVEDFNPNTLSVTQRIDYMKDACKLIGKYGLLGIGADGWKDRQYEVQDYFNFANEVHSYILEIFCEFGIIGFISLSLIIIYTMALFINGLKKSNFELGDSIIKLATIVLLIHSCIDFELSFMFILVILYALLAMSSYGHVDKKVDKKIINIFCLLITLSMVIYSIYLSIYICKTIYRDKKDNPYSVEYIVKNIKDSKGLFKNNIDKIVDRRKYQSHAKIFTKIIENNKELKEENLYYLFKLIQNEDDIGKYCIDTYGDKIEFYNFLIMKRHFDKEKQQEIDEQLKLEINETRNLISQPEKCRLGISTINSIIDRLNKMEKDEKIN